MTTQPLSRRRDDFIISNDRALLSLRAINDAFASDELYWCKPLDSAALKVCLDNSFVLGLYHDESATKPPVPLGTAPAPRQIGFLRMITDYTTFAYLTDVYILPEYQGRGLGKWLIQCLGEVLAGMKDLRRAMLITGEGKGSRFYENELGFSKMEQGKGGLCVMHRLGNGATKALMD